MFKFLKDDFLKNNIEILRGSLHSRVDIFIIVKIFANFVGQRNTALVCCPVNILHIQKATTPSAI